MLTERKPSHGNNISKLLSHRSAPSYGDCVSFPLPSFHLLSRIWQLSQCLFSLSCLRAKGYKLKATPLMIQRGPASFDFPSFIWLLFPIHFLRVSYRDPPFVPLIEGACFIDTPRSVERRDRIFGFESCVTGMVQIEIHCNVSRRKEKYFFLINSGNIRDVLFRRLNISIRKIAFLLNCRILKLG